MKHKLCHVESCKIMARIVGWVLKGWSLTRILNAMIETMRPKMQANRNAITPYPICPTCGSNTSPTLSQKPTNKNHIILNKCNKNMPSIFDGN